MVERIVGKGRVEAFSDGVIAVIITIMVLEIKTPHGTDSAALLPLIPVFLSYVLSFMYIGIYWNNHHHLFHTVHKINGPILWANLHLLFWLSLVPFLTEWISEHHDAPIPVAAYGFALLMAGVAYYILARLLVRLHGNESTIARALGTDIKGKLSVVLYAVAILLTCVNTWLSIALYVAVALMWLVPDRRVEKILHDHGTTEP
jgi:uncharacterized membrane protein